MDRGTFAKSGKYRTYEKKSEKKVQKSGRTLLKRMGLADRSLEIDEARKRQSEAKKSTYHRVHRGMKNGGHGDCSDGEQRATNSEKVEQRT